MQNSASNLIHTYVYYTISRSAWLRAARKRVQKSWGLYICTKVSRYILVWGLGKVPEILVLGYYSDYSFMSYIHNLYKDVLYYFPNVLSYLMNFQRCCKACINIWIPKIILTSICRYILLLVLTSGKAKSCIANIGEINLFDLFLILFGLIVDHLSSDFDHMGKWYYSSDTVYADIFYPCKW